MYTKLQTLVSPTLNDPAEARRQYLLNIVLLFLTSLGIAVCCVEIILSLFRQGSLLTGVAWLCTSAFCILAYWLARRGQIRLASYIPALIIFLLMIWGSMLIGVRPSTCIGFVLATLVAGILIGLPAGFLFAISSAGAMLWITLNQNNAGIPASSLPAVALSADIAGVLLGLIAIVAISHIYLSQLNQALLSEQELGIRVKGQQREFETASEDRTLDLQRRVSAVRTAADISRMISAVLAPKELLQRVVDLVRERFDLYYVGIFLVDERSQSATLGAGTGEAGEKMVAEKHKLAIAETSMIGWTITHRQPRIALDVGQDAIRFVNPHLPLTRSEMALPLISGNRILGAMTIQSDKGEAFDEEDIIVLQGISDTLAVALDNARLFRELQQNLSEIQKLHRQYLQDAWSSKTREEEGIQYTYETSGTLPTNIPGINFPLSLREEIIGQLTLESQTDWTPEEKNLIEAIATQAALALENARLLEETQQIALRERLITDITSKIWTSATIDGILQTAVKELGQAMNASEATIELKADEDGNDKSS